WPAVQIPLLGRSSDLFPAGSASDRSRSRSQGRKYRIQPADSLGRTADHHAVTALQSPHASARADVQVMDLFGCKLLRSPNVIDVIGIAAVNQNVPGFEIGNDLGDHLVDNARRHHEPDSARLF